MSEKNKLVIKKAAEEDIPLLLDFIKKIAEYEKMLDQVIATEDDLRESFFGKERSVHALIGYYEEKAVCFAIYFYNFSSFIGRKGLYLEDLYVLPEMRGKGFGKQMLVHLAGIAKAENCKRFEWSVLDWNTPAVEFYKMLGAEPMDEWTVFRMRTEAIKKLSETT